MIYQLEAARDTFEKKFRFVDGHYYFTLKDTEWMLPVTEDEYFNARSLFETMANVAVGLTWVVTLGSVGYGAYLYMFLERPLIQFLGAWLAGFVICFLINLYPQTIPTMSMWERLRHAQKLDDESKQKMLMRRTELI